MNSRMIEAWAPLEGMDIQWTPSERKRLKFYLTIIDNNAVIEIQKPEKPGQALAVVGWLIIIVGFFISINSIGFTGWFVPTGVERATSICLSYLFVGMCLIAWNIVLEHKYASKYEKSEIKAKGFLIILFGIEIFIGIGYILFD